MVSITKISQQKNKRSLEDKDVLINNDRAMTIPDDPTNLYLQYTGYTDYFPLLRLAEMAAIEGNCGKALEYIKEASMLYPLNDA